MQQDLAQKGVEKELIASTLETAYEDVDEVALARQYIARKRMKQPSGENKQKETVRAMNRLMRAGFSSRAIFKVLREWDGGLRWREAEFAEPEERAGNRIRMPVRMRRMMNELVSWWTSAALVLPDFYLACRAGRGPLRSATPQTKTCLRGPWFRRALGLVYRSWRVG